MLHSGLHPGTSRINGSGIIALRDIPAGTAVWWPCPRCTVLTVAEQVDAPENVLRWIGEFGYRRADGALITPCGGAFLFNHSCDAAVLDAGLSAGVAVRDIAKGEEVACDYRGFRYEDPWEFLCDCGSPDCVGPLRSTRGEPPAALAAMWSERLQRALTVAASVPQETTILSGDIHGWR